MSQQKTIVPDVDYDALPTGDWYGDMYTRTNSGKTIPPAHPYDQRTPVTSGAKMPMQQPASGQRVLVMQERVLVGVLYSMSRGIIGEIFPLYLGRNIIGMSEKCDVRLQEATVSPEHAILHVKKHETDGGAHYEATVTDFNSMYGTAVNGVDGRYDSLDVNDGDVMLVGAHYKFLVRFFDKMNATMEEDADFTDSVPQAAIIPTEDSGSSFYTPTQPKGQDSSRTVIY